MKQLCRVTALSLCAFVANASSKDWNGITPCVSTRIDVEVLLGKDKVPIDVGIYTHNELRVHVRYGQNDKSAPGKDIVEKIDVYPGKKILFEKYASKIPGFHKQFVKTTLDDDITHVHGRAVYRNWTEGFEIWVQRNHKDVEVISSFGYFDPAWDCSKSLAPQSEKTKK